MNKESIIPDVPEELQHSEGINTPILYTTHQYTPSSKSKSKSKIVSTTTAQYFSTSYKYTTNNVVNAEIQYSVLHSQVLT
jgi:hypothetical protein